MRTIKVNAINSTNELARDFYTGKSLFEPVCLTAHTQTRGKGQRGAGWISNPGENLTFSLLYPETGIAADRQFLLSASVALAIMDVLEVCNIPKLKVKWPNDIMAANCKICGILIENILKKDAISASVIGIGLNVNQTLFPNLPQAGSLQQMTGKHYDTDILLEKLLKSLDARLRNLGSFSGLSLLQEYEARMFKKDVVSAFQLPDGSHLTGIIRGVTDEGLLKLEVEDGVFKTFDLKEIRLLF
ncbi:biotin--[acetyl-CoA-carboxylase] ligase [Zunongwangia sp. F363]|uniref:Biotin--[acetyl-CoA-carboxylase] ligase n=1 Tax=Autumnicola tepida TaxID=3075595 RepID=A0ABU3C7Z8_9FLAO|nr:biotin--[acetyl-CoA-carboxylase] ligase [Zunongwangia sp. F363]MDT0642461.1 biotin--[acetyl-CoA-carboxylase] ligase [Zunongwangia sp. F363]